MTRILRNAPHHIPTPRRPRPDFSLHYYHAIISSLFDDLAVQRSYPKNSPDHLPIELEPVGGELLKQAKIGAFLESLL